VTSAQPCNPPQPTNIVPVAATLPTMRAIESGNPATFFASIIAAGTGTACNCTITPTSGPPAGFLYQTTNSSNALTGSPNTPVNIAGGATQTFLIAYTPSSSFDPTEARLSFKCANTPEATIIPFVNSVILASTPGPVADMVALAATLNNDGIVNIPGPTGTGVFSVATVNACEGSALITVSANATGPFGSGSGSLPVNLNVCQTNPATGDCLAPPAPSANLQVAPGSTATFGVFVKGNGNVPFDPGNNRIYFVLKEGSVLRGATSVAVRTQ
jgi:hypothetical protein